ncbi:DUF2975 domain-containing protein [Microcella sp.]|uniref:DUF2975 domain-containing protein n=1 Tax=Microcella sp. TaxID=1913979 RepID=UPI00299F5559|nr:DUF2975 domain-containing protein [Microcella sp.]MDX2026070.1 DUF2975 domain-containing protein [Microcella sp.]
MNRITIVSLKALIGLLLALLLLCQVAVVPAIASQMADRIPPLAFLQWPGVIAAAVFVLCLQTALGCVWRLLTLTREGVIFNARAFRYVDVILAAIVVATVVVLGSLVVITNAGAATPSLALLGVLGVVVGSMLALLVVVLRGLLRKATQLESDLAEVV